jgi:hypothetical protein
VYLSRTYPALVPYLKGIHLTVDSWRPNRDPSGWKMDIASGEQDQPFDIIPDASAPAFVTAVGQLQDDIVALDTLFARSRGCPKLRLPSMVSVTHQVQDSELPC